MQRGEQIAIWRKKRGLTQTELADRVGVPRSLISQWESGVRRPHYENMFPRVCKALGVEINLTLTDIQGETEKLPAQDGSVME